MESLAFIHIAINYEDASPDPEVKAFKNLNIPTSAAVSLAGVTVAATVLAGTSDKAMAATQAIAPGSSGQAVESIQTALGIQTDGKYGAKTETAVMDFQIRQGLKKIDGVVGKETAQALGLDENYRPVGYVDTYSGIGLNIRSGPGLGYWRIGGAPDGAYLYQDYESVVYNDGYAWTPLYYGGWVASEYTTDYYYPVSYYEGGYGYDDDYYYGGYGEYYTPVSYGGGYRDCGCYRPTAYYYYRGCGWSVY